MPLSKEDEAQFSGLLAAAMDRPKPTFQEKLSTAEVLRKWALIILIGVVATAAEINTRRENSKRITTLEKKMREVRPLVLQHEWQVKQGLTNKDLKERGLTAPEFKEDE